MTSEDVRTVSLEDLLAEGDRHPGAAALVAEVQRCISENDGLLYAVERARLEGWLERHLAPRYQRAATWSPPAAHAVPSAGCIPAPIAKE